MTDKSLPVDIHTLLFEGIDSHKTCYEAHAPPEPPTSMLEKQNGQATGKVLSPELPQHPMWTLINIDQWEAGGDWNRQRYCQRDIVFTGKLLSVTSRQKES